MEIIDLSQEIFSGMPVYKSLPKVKIKMYASHEEWEGITDSKKITPSIYKLEMSEHAGTHIDALNHMSRKNEGQSIDTMPLSSFITEGICLDFSHKGLKEIIDYLEIEEQCEKEGLIIKENDTVLFYTDHYRKYYNTLDWVNGPGLSAKATRFLGSKKIAAFGVETMSPGVPKVSNKEVHYICGEMGFTHYENLINLNLLIGKGRFRFIGLPLKIRGGTGSPVRAVAILNDNY